ncbi:hypothetical protein [Halarcobacter sp.]|uniref:hypothetical protein n=1 Tax=Halarcobacter sp. TaxID=2321133 RepID=UPI0029F509F2|nr:hypothetical protein [Halarcobacter sp.]
MLIAILLSACAGKSFKWNDVRSVKIGDSKEILAKKMHTKPYRITTSQINGEHIEQYIYVYVGFDGSTKSVLFPIKNNKVVSIPHVPDEFK